MKNIIDALNWRYAVQEFDKEKKLSSDKLSILLEALRLSPSSYGIQPWKFIVVANPSIREKLREAAFGQPKVTDASHLLILAIRKNIDDALVDFYIQTAAETRGVSAENLKGYSEIIKRFLQSKSAEERKEWASRQVYIALGTLLTTAALEEIDAGPMEGFDPKKVDEILGLEKMGLESRVLVAVGYRSPNDKSAKAPKVRFARKDTIIEMR